MGEQRKRCTSCTARETVTVKVEINPFADSAFLTELRRAIRTRPAD